MKHPKFKENQKMLEEFSDPVALADHLHKHTADFAHAAPNIALGLHSSITNGLQFLNSKMPHPLNNMPLAKDKDPPLQAQHKFNSYFDIIHDPLSALEHVKNGTLTSHHMEALQNVYPSLLSEMQKSVLSNMDIDDAKDLKYPTKVALSKFLGQPMDESLTPQSVLAKQQAMTPSRPEMNAGTQKNSTQSGLNKLDIAKGFQTRTQQLEAGSES